MGNLRGSSPQRFYEGSLASAEILLNLIAVAILASPETLDVAKRTTFIHSKFTLFKNYLYSYAVIAKQYSNQGKITLK